MKLKTIGKNVVIGLTGVVILFVYLFYSGFYAIFALEEYYMVQFGIDFSSDLGSQKGVAELGVLAMLYASVAGVFLLALVKPAYWVDFHKYFIVSNLFTILGRVLVLSQGYYDSLQFLNIGFEVFFVIYAFWRLKQLSKAKRLSLFIYDE